MTTRRQVLDDVAAGRLAPEEAIALLDGLEAEASHADDGTGPGPTVADAVEVSTIRRVRVSSELGHVRVVGDDGVREAIAGEGLTARREGDALVVTDDRDEVDLGSFHGTSIGERLRRLGAKPRTATVRMHPSLALEVVITAGAVSISGVRGPIRANVNLGKLEVTGLAAPFEVALTAGQAVLEGRLTDGTSTLRCELGQARVHLVDGSSVTVGARADLGEVTLPDGPRRDDRVVVGAGAGRLDVSTAAGQVVVTA